VNKTEYIKNHNALFWAVPKEKRATISDTLLVETILNYGTWEDVNELFELIGLKQTATIFFAASQNRARHNFLPQVENYFRIYFQHHAR
jgi:hypothetical protein